MPTLLLAKILVVPSFLFFISIAGRYWGSFVSGILSGLPVIAGPITVFLAIEQGEAFAITASQSTLQGILALLCFCFVYGKAALAWHWLPSLLIGWTSYMMVVMLLTITTFSPLLSIALICLCIRVFTWFTPTEAGPVKILSISAHEILCRMGCAAALVLAVTHFADTLGTTYSGVFAAFPIAATVLAVFTHAFHGGYQASLLLRGVMFGVLSLAIFYCTLSLTAPHLGFYLSCCVAVAAVFLLQSVNYYRLSRRDVKRD